MSAIRDLTFRRWVCLQTLEIKTVTAALRQEKTVDSRKKLDAKANKLDTTGGNETKRPLSLMNEIKHLPTVQTRKKSHSKVNCGALC